MTSPNLPCDGAALAGQSAPTVERLGYTISEVCQMIPCSPPTVYRMIADRRLSRIKIGRKALITAPSLRRLFSEAA